MHPVHVATEPAVAYSPRAGRAWAGIIKLDLEPLIVYLRSKRVPEEAVNSLLVAFHYPAEVSLLEGGETNGWYEHLQPAVVRSPGGEEVTFQTVLRVVVKPGRPAVMSQTIWHEATHAVCQYRRPAARPSLYRRSGWIRACRWISQFVSALSLLGWFSIMIGMAVGAVGLAWLLLAMLILLPFLFGALLVQVLSPEMVLWLLDPEEMVCRYQAWRHRHQVLVTWQ